MAFNTANAFDIVCRLDRNDTLGEVPLNKKSKVATGLLLDKLRKQDFAWPLSSRASRVLGPISRHRVADILLHMKSVSRASRPGLLVGFLRILCDGLCTAQRFQTEEHDHTCRIGCPNEPDSLTHYNECPRLHNIFVSFWRHATILPRRNHILHDLITRVFLRSLQYGIVVLVWKFWRLHERKDSLYDGHHSCLRPRVPGNVSCTKLTWCPAPQLPAAPTQIQLSVSSQCSFITRERGNDYRGCAIYTDGGTRVVDGETLAGWDGIPDLLMDELTSCLVPSSPLGLILLSLVPEHTPTTLQK